MLDTSSTSLLKEWRDQKKFIDMPEAKHKEYEKSLETKMKVDMKKHQTFTSTDGDLDRRTEEQKGSTVLHRGYGISAGIKGSKLSGG